MYPIYLLNIMIFVFSIYNAIGYKKFKSDYPDMSMGFHLREICYNKETWDYGNKLATKVSIILSVILFLIVFPLTLFFNFERFVYIIILIALIIIYIIFLILILKIKMRKRFKY